MLMFQQFYQLCFRNSYHRCQSYHIVIYNSPKIYNKSDYSWIPRGAVYSADGTLCDYEPFCT